jgi:hypothetical protein
MAPRPPPNPKKNTKKSLKNSKIPQIKQKLILKNTKKISKLEKFPLRNVWGKNRGNIFLLFGGGAFLEWIFVFF